MTSKNINYSKSRIILFLILTLLTTTPLFATWTIIAVDTETKEIGAAGASFTPALWSVLGIVGGKGIIAAQAATNLDAKQLGIQMLLDKKNAEDILKTVTDPHFDPDF